MLKLRYLLLIVTLSALSPYLLLAVTPQSYEFLSPVYKVDRLYKSMTGPQSSTAFSILEKDTPELLWITGYRSVMVGADGITPMPQEFMCHSNLDLDIQEHRRIFQWNKTAAHRMFTLSQGQFEIKFPDGFGVPIYSNEIFTLTTQVLNLNFEDQEYQVRHKVMINYLFDHELEREMKPLFMKAANGLVLVNGENGYYNVDVPDKSLHGEGCLIGHSASGKVRTDKYGREFAGHWVLKPGRQSNKTLVTNWMNLPFDTTLHYIAVHLHPFAEFLELRDLTANKSVFKSTVTGFKNSIGIDHVDYYSSESGIPLYKDHEYELLSVYNNTTSSDKDVMAVMYLYVLDKEFRNN